MIRFFQMLALTGIFWACNDPAQKAKQPNVYYDVATFVKGQVEALNTLKPTVNKVLNIKGKKEIQTTKAVNWTRELELFTQADINKPAFRTSYQITRPDSLTYQYNLKSGEKLTVQSLRVRLDAATHKPRQIEAVLTTKNPLYNSERRLLLESGPAANKQWLVQHYSMNGFQQLTFFGKNDFFVDGNVR